LDYWPTSANPKTEHGAIHKLGITCYFPVTSECNFWRHLVDYVESNTCLQSVPCMPTVLLTIWFLVKMLLGEGSCSLFIRSLEKWGKKNHSRLIAKFFKLQNIY